MVWKKTTHLPQWCLLQTVLQRSSYSPASSNRKDNCIEITSPHLRSMSSTVYNHPMGAYTGQNLGREIERIIIETIKSSVLWKRKHQDGIESAEAWLHLFRERSYVYLTVRLPVFYQWHFKGLNYSGKRKGTISPLQGDSKAPERFSQR